MIFGQDRGELRRMYADAWSKFRDGAVLSPLQTQIAQVIEDHPEYRDAVPGALALYLPSTGLNAVAVAGSAATHAAATASNTVIVLIISLPSPSTRRASVCQKRSWEGWGRTRSPSAP